MRALACPRVAGLPTGLTKAFFRPLALAAAGRPQPPEELERKTEIAPASSRPVIAVFLDGRCSGGGVPIRVPRGAPEVIRETIQPG